MFLSLSGVYQVAWPRVKYQSDHDKYATANGLFSVICYLMLLTLFCHTRIRNVRRSSDFWSYRRKWTCGVIVVAAEVTIGIGVTGEVFVMVSSFLLTDRISTITT
jgi:hypothetical protein